MRISDLVYWLFTLPHDVMDIDFTICGYTFSMWDCFIFVGLVAIFGVIVSILRE